MKYKTTKRETMVGFNNVICVSYCALQRLLSQESPCAYTARREGWAADVYAFGSTAIVTGYSAFGNLKADHDICIRYENKAAQILERYGVDYQECRNHLDKLICQFIEEVKRGVQQ